MLILSASLALRVISLDLSFRYIHRKRFKEDRCGECAGQGGLHDGDKPVSNEGGRYSITAMQSSSILLISHRIHVNSSLQPLLQDWIFFTWVQCITLCSQLLNIHHKCNVWSPNIRMVCDSL